jgi:uncharacterized protein YndB with AHSA1/START domain
MTTHDHGQRSEPTTQFTVPHRLEFTFVLPGTAEQVWDAIATANGISSWMTPTDVEERVGGAICFHMGPDVSSEGTVTAFDAPHRFAIVEPDWALLVGHDRDSVGPMATEFLIEAQSGGTCVLRVVTSAFGTGADWEQEFFADMTKHWAPQFDNLRVYLAHFAGKRGVFMDVEAPVRTTPPAMWATMRRAIGGGRELSVGDALELQGLTGVIERINADPGPNELLLRVDAPVEGYVGFMTWETAADTTTAVVAGRFFSDNAPTYVDQEHDGWKKWLDGIAAEAVDLKRGATA